MKTWCNRIWHKKSSAGYRKHAYYSHLLFTNTGSNNKEVLRGASQGSLLCRRLRDSMNPEYKKPYSLIVSFWITLMSVWVPFRLLLLSLSTITSCRVVVGGANQRRIHRKSHLNSVSYKLTVCLWYTGWPKKVSHYQMIQKSYEIVLKPVNKIRFIGQIKVWIKHYNIIPWY